MRVLIVSTNFMPAHIYGGPPRATLNTAKALRRMGNEVLVLTTNAFGRRDLEGPLGSITSYEGVPVIYFNRQVFKSFYLSMGLAMFLYKNAHAFDIALIKGHWTFINIVSTSILRIKRKPFCLYPEGCLDSWAIRYRGIKKSIYWTLIEKYNYRRADGFIAASVQEEKQLRKLGFNQPIKIVPNALSRAEFVAISNNSTSERDIFNPSSKIIFFMARIHPKKGLDLLLYAFEKIRNRLPNTKLVVAGSGEAHYENYIKKLVSVLGLKEHVLFVGTVSKEKMISILNKTDVFVLPSHSEGMPMAVQNAMAFGVPVIVSKYCNMPEISEYGAGIILNNLYAQEELENAIFFLLNNESINRQMRINAMRLVDELYSYERTGNALTEFCMSLISTLG